MSGRRGPAGVSASERAGHPGGGSGRGGRRSALDAMIELLARELTEAGRTADDRFTVAELRRSFLPYPHCRETLGLASKAEYDVALLRLIHADGLLVADDPALDEEVDRELSSPEPALGVLDDHAATTLEPGSFLRRALAADRGEEDTAPTKAGSDPRAGAPEEAPGAGEVSEPAAGAPSTPEERGGAPEPADGPAGPGDEGGAWLVSRQEEEHLDPAAGACGACGDDLPERAGLRYCPHCGAALRASPCRACGEELEAGWRYCPFCGSERHA